MFTHMSVTRVLVITRCTPGRATVVDRIDLVIQGICALSTVNIYSRRVVEVVGVGVVNSTSIEECMITIERVIGHDGLV